MRVWLVIQSSLVAHLDGGATAMSIPSGDKKARSGAKMRIVAGHVEIL